MGLADACRERTCFQSAELSPRLRLAARQFFDRAWHGVERDALRRDPLSHVALPGLAQLPRLPSPRAFLRSSARRIRRARALSGLVLATGLGLRRHVPYAHVGAR